MPSYDEIYGYCAKALQQSDFAQGAVIASILATLWGMVKAIPIIVWPRIKRRILYTATIEQSDKMYQLTSDYIYKHWKDKFRSVSGSLSRIQVDAHGGVFKETDTINKKLFLDNLDDFFFVWKNWRYLSISCTREKMEHGNIAQAYLGRITISGFFAKKAIIKILDEIRKTQKENVQIKNQYWNVESNWYGKKLPSYKNLNSIFFPEKEELISELETFTKSKEWYFKRGIPYKKGIMLHGPPGTGKTSLALSLCHHLDRNLYLMSLTDVTNTEFTTLAANIRSNSIVLIDDMDICLANRDTDKKTVVTLNTLLSFLDGASSPDDVIIMATTNHIDRFDPAIIRKGRFDISIEMTYPNSKCVNDYLSNYWEKESDYYFDKLTIPMVDIQTYCLNSNSLNETIGKIEHGNKKKKKNRRKQTFDSNMSSSSV